MRKVAENNVPDVSLKKVFLRGATGGLRLLSDKKRFVESILAGLPEFASDEEERGNHSCSSLQEKIKTSQKYEQKIKKNSKNISLHKTSTPKYTIS